MGESHVDVLVMGRVLADLYANEMNTPLSGVRTFTRYLGGSAGNTAVGLARLGVEAGLISRVGPDGFGEFLLHQLKTEGVNTDMVRPDPGAPTALSFAEIHPPTHFNLLFYRKPCADTRVQQSDIDPDVLRSTPYFLTNLTALSESPSREAALWALEEHRRAGGTNLFDLDWRPMLWSGEQAARTYARAALRLTDYAIANEEELEFAGEAPDPPSAAQLLLDLGVRYVVAKRGAAGVTVYARDGQVAHAPPFRVDVLNTLGAGDGFAAGFVTGLVRGWSLQRCAQVGNSVGAIVVTRHSCSEAIPYWPEVEEFLAEHGG